MLKKREVIIFQVTTRIRKTIHNHRIEVPTSLKHAAEIYSRNKSTFWRDAIAKEMKSTCVSFDMLETGQVSHVRHEITSGHTILDMNMDFTRKTRWLLDGHRNPSPKGSTCAGIVSHENARIYFTYTSLNDVYFWGCDVQKVFLLLLSISATSLRLAGTSILCLCVFFLILDVT